MTSREQFESWYFKRYGVKDLTVVRNHAEFCDALEVWQASRAAIEIEQMKALTTRDALAAGYTADYATGVEHGIQVMENAIELAGLKVKA
ncbi:hypothetical protein KP591P3_00018 [Klebsiella phage KP591P3]|uniref:hypothetical protein n=1 Tax=Klebsiella phage KP591P1 TaxID=2968665 RepID=UPI00233F231F|nr:hypothetical protein PRB84_gp55 [Klebsiella phage KP591P1]YP_010685434.1 hypothetical protein PRB85_gp18 [Klebsiella phage KP591P3]WAX16336.1 hypothetical protein KP591P1_00055 [Klebsiella phage KP591P1]WAX16377.1 hypothetical protein KP591P3_00018 [Klebsiella phage KP591P3]